MISASTIIYHCTNEIIALRILSLQNLIAKATHYDMNSNSFLSFSYSDTNRTDHPGLRSRAAAHGVRVTHESPFTEAFVRCRYVPVRHP